MWESCTVPAVPTHEQFRRRADTKKKKKVPHNKVGILKRAKVPSFLTGKLGRVQTQKHTLTSVNFLTSSYWDK